MSDLEGMIYSVTLRDGRYELSDDAFDWLWPLSPECAPTDPLKGKWEAMDEEQYAVRSQLYAVGLIDANGNMTENGKAVVEKIMEAQDDDSLFIRDCLEMRELDDLDRECRKRPRPNYYDG